MVLDRGDYNVRNLWSGNWDPTSPVNFTTKLVGGIFVLTVLVWSFLWARNQGVPLMNRATTFLTGGRVATDQTPRVF